MKLLSINRNEGRAFYEDGGKLYMLRPFFTESIPCEEHIMRSVESQGGFDSVNENFDSVDDIIKYIRETYISSGSGRELTQEQLKNIVLNASDDLLIKYIGKAIDEWIPNNKTEAAKLLINDICEIKNLESRPKLLDALAELAIVLYV